MELFIAGTRGIPNRYGGFEQFAEKLSTQLADRELAVTVFNPHTHEFLGEEIRGVRILRVKSHENFLGVLGTLLYDFHCLRKAYREKDGVVLLCGYGSAFLVRWFFRKQIKRTIIHMDGLEWQRSKWNRFFRGLLKKLERFTALRFPHMVVDHPHLAEYYQAQYGVQPHVISYGAEPGPLENLNKEHYLIIARLEPENNVEMILEGYLQSGAQEKMLVVGDVNTKFGRKLLKKYGLGMQIVFTGGIFDQDKLSEFRKKSILYFHGHSVGGTNPSLLQAMADGCLIACHDNEFNRFVLGDYGWYFKSAEEVKKLISEKDHLSINLSEMIDFVQINYAWGDVADKFFIFIEEILLRRGER